MRRVPDLTRAKELLGWAPKRTLNDIITEIASGVTSGEERVLAGTTTD
jgi:nucleoside-diphosphate-sugar epimerase